MADLLTNDHSNDKHVVLRQALPLHAVFRRLFGITTPALCSNSTRLTPMVVSRIEYSFRLAAMQWDSA